MAILSDIQTGTIGSILDAIQTGTVVAILSDIQTGTVVVILSDIQIGTVMTPLPGIQTGTVVSTLPDAWRYTVSAMVGVVSAYCRWVGEQIKTAISLSVWQHVKLSVQIRPWYTLACFWDFKQPTSNKNVRDNCKLINFPSRKVHWYLNVK